MTGANYKWIYTYDYAPDSVWEPWREMTGEPEWIRSEAEAVIRRVAENTTGSSDHEQTDTGECGSEAVYDRSELLTFLLLADSHYTYNGTWDDTMAAMRRLVAGLDVKGIIHLGDLTDGLLPLKKTMEIEEICLSDMQSLGKPVMLVPGNHDYNYFRRNPDIKYPDTPQFYIDMPEDKLRMIFIDSFDPREEVRYGFTDYCIHWLDSILRQMPDDHIAVIFSHLTPLVRLQAWTKNIRNREKLMAVLDRYSERILAYINGHNHCDHLFNELYNGRFPIVSINCAKCEYFTDHKPEGAEIPYRELGGRNQESFDIMQIDTAGRRIFFTRFGAGRDRIVENGRAEYVGELS